jgi:pyruvate/2-oxoglutarate dehydrogenase complex dihydrolipoamide dehydrogenase (E3) component
MLSLHGLFHLEAKEGTLPDRFDAVVVGMGPGGEVAATRLIDGGMKVAVVERELIGGECSYWACVPSKTLLRPGEARSEAEDAAGVKTPDLVWQEISDYRDFMVRNLDDSKQVKDYEDKGAEVIKGSGRLAGPRVVEVDGRRLEAAHIVVATGSDPVMPPIDGLEDVTVWTNREATGLTKVPDSAVVVGGGPVGIEMSQVLARFGAEVTLVQGADRLLNREDPGVCRLVHGALERDGIDVRVGTQVSATERDGARARVTLSNGDRITAEVVVIGAGRSPRTRDMGFETVGVTPARRGLEVDEQCKAADGVWAVGDVTGVALFTHVAKYQGRTVAANLLGTPAAADYRSIPRVVFSDPEVAAVGMTEQQARDKGIDVATSSVDLPESIARPWTYQSHPIGQLGLIADRHRGVLVGAWAVAPLASEWIHEAVLAVRAEVPLATLLDTVAQFPSFAEAYLVALERLDL